MTDEPTRRRRHGPRPKKKPARPPGSLVSLADISQEEWEEIYGSEDEPKRILERARMMLALAERGLTTLLSGEQQRQVEGICDVAVYGRAVSLAAQHARTRHRAAFNEWYRPWESEFNSDELFRYFNNLRNRVLKDGPPRAVGYRTAKDNDAFMRLALRIINEIASEFQQDDSYASMSTQFFEDPPIARAEVTLKDGKTVVRMVALPEEDRLEHRTFTYLPDPPMTHLGEVIRDVTLQNLSALYVARLDAFVSSFAAFVESL